MCGLIDPQVDETGLHFERGRDEKVNRSRAIAFISNKDRLLEVCVDRALFKHDIVGEGYERARADHSDWDGEFLSLCHNDEVKREICAILGGELDRVGDLNAGRNFGCARYSYKLHREVRRVWLLNLDSSCHRVIVAQRQISDSCVERFTTFKGNDTRKRLKDGLINGNDTCCMKCVVRHVKKLHNLRGCWRKDERAYSSIPKLTCPQKLWGSCASL